MIVIDLHSSLSLISVKKAISIIKKQAALIPKLPGVYKMLGVNNKNLYVGKAKLLPKRILSYANYRKLPNRLCRMILQLESIEFIITKTEAEALLLEANLIKSLKPIYNIKLRDDKSFPYILIEDGHPYPRIGKYRGDKNIKGSYFGPFSSANDVKEAIIELQKIFLLRSCSDGYFTGRTRPCLQYQIKRCSAPCVKKIEREDYALSIKHAKEFLTGKSSEIKDYLISRMNEAGADLKFEEAARIRDRIKILNSIQAKNNLADLKVKDVDIISIYSDDSSDMCCIQVFFIRGGKNYGNKSYIQEDVAGMKREDILETFVSQFYQGKQIPGNIYLSCELKNINILNDAISRLAGQKITISNPLKKGIKKDLVDFAIDNAKKTFERTLKEKHKHVDDLEKISSLFELPKIPNRIEIYDNSHLNGTNGVGCMVVYGVNGFEKSGYRRFNIKTTDKGDDYKMLNEVLTRRLKKIDNSNKPDLMIIDGGLGHLKVTLQVLYEFNISDIEVVCIAKGVKRNAGREVFYMKDKPPLRLSKSSISLHFLQNLRDEVHKYAISSHIKKRSKSMYKSSVSDIPGIGNHRKKLLLKHFGSLDEIKKASVRDLLNVKGINVIYANKIHNHLHNNH
jgi:excinuclease ABC subunit C